MTTQRWAMVLTAWLCGTALAAGNSGLDPSGFDPQVRVQDDLFLAVNGGWMKNTPIPADKSAYGVFQEMSDRADDRVKLICEELGAAHAVPGSNEQKVGSFYSSFLNEAAIDAAGTAPLAPYLAQIDAATTQPALAALWGRWQGVVDTPVAVAIGGDPKQPTIYRVMLVQAGLGLPDRDYYLKHDAHFTRARDAYLTYVQTLLQLGGDAQAAEHAQAVLALETRLAQAQWSKVDSMDALKTYNPMTPAVIARRAPGVDWHGFFDGAATPAIDRLSVQQPSYVRALSKLLHDEPLATWQLYLRVRLFDGYAQVLPKAWRDADYAFHGKVLRGQEQDKPRWQKATAAMDGALGEAVGQVYVARYFPPAYKARMKELVGNLFAAYAESIDHLSWMTPATKQRAREKLAKYTVKIGYPDHWRDYAALDVREGDALGNEARAGRFEHERMAKRVGQPVDRTEWGMTPQTVNAYYDPSLNEVVFPAAILDAPFFDMSADDAANYGATGATIGHEISHGFDNQGSQYDGDGKLQNWWSRADRKAFDALGTRLAQQYDAYQPLPGHALNGRLTLTENIADLSGLEIGYKAYQLSLNGQSAPMIDGTSGDQRFFLSWAASWREKVRDARLLELVTTDPHAPAAFRTNGAVVNLDAFHQAFGTRPGDRLYKPVAQRIRIW